MSFLWIRKSILQFTHLNGLCPSLTEPIPMFCQPTTQISHMNDFSHHEAKDSTQLSDFRVVINKFKNFVQAFRYWDSILSITHDEFLCSVAIEMF